MTGQLLICQLNGAYFNFTVRAVCAVSLSIQYRNLHFEERNWSSRHQSGLTMSELMVTVSTIGILAALALPCFNSVINQNRVRLVVDTVVGDFRQAEGLAQAAGAGQTAVLEISNPGASWEYTVTHTSSGIK